MTSFFLGEHVVGRDRDGRRVELDGDDLTTHGVIVGMTGSGKTGLGVVLIEEALRAGVPVLVLDPKGDMTNLALRFPGLTTEEFAPWVPAGSDAAAVAETWQEGLASWGLGTGDVADLADRSSTTVYTPGSAAGVPLDLVGSLAAPATDDPEVRLDEIEGVVSGLLSLVGIDADPLSSREHILLTNLVAHAWSAGTDLDLGTLVGQVQTPPIRKLGVIELDTFYPEPDRSALAMKLNGLLASPAFAAWAQGAPLDIGAMLTPRADGVAPCSVVYLAHLSEEERQFVVTLVLSKVVTWMRSQPGSAGLRALVYMDEVFGYVPPTAQPPAKKPILTILKQARAFGVGMVLSTQNPVDLDYKALSNAGAWMIGRLQTERDVARLSEGLAAAAGSVDVDAVTGTISGLPERTFVLHTTGGDAPSVFTTRWAMHYLAGPLTRDQLGALPGQPETAPGVAETPAPDAPAALADDELGSVPEIAEGIPVRWADPAAPWLAEVGGAPGSTTHVAGIAARVGLLFDDAKADLRLTDEFECIATGLGERFDPAEAVRVDYDARDLRETAPAGATYRLPDAPLGEKGWFRDAEAALEDHLYRSQTTTVRVNEALDLHSRPGESEEDFLARCAVEADRRTDEEAARIRNRLEAKMSTVRSAIEREQIRVSELQARAADSKQHEVISAAGDVLGSLLGGRRSTRSILSKAKGVSSRRKQTSAAADRVESALAKVEQKQMDLAELEAELTDALAEVAAEWDERADDVTETEVSLEKADVRVTELVVVWIPV
jgi:hypothetical protein